MKLLSIAKTTVALFQLKGILDLCFMFVLKMTPEKFKGKVLHDDFPRNSTENTRVRLTHPTELAQ